MKIGKILKKIDKKFKSQKFSEINFNSKKCRNGDVFFAIKRKNKDGNLYLKELFSKGALLAVVNKILNIKQVVNAKYYYSMAVV